MFVSRGILNRRLDPSLVLLGVSALIALTSTFGAQARPTDECLFAAAVADPPAACCDPSDEPGPGNQFCINGHACCDDGEWRCNGDGLECAPGVLCPSCCPTIEEPGAYGNPPCASGASCCSTGTWQCDDSNGDPTCDAPGPTCPMTCCLPEDQPGTDGRAPCDHGNTCCANGLWTCNDVDAQSTCDTRGEPCESTCCDPAAKPDCAQGATCCDTGEWLCNDGSGLSTCDNEGRACGEACCDPRLGPNDVALSSCTYGASCCGDGIWGCNAPSGESTCDTAGTECVKCCDLSREPGRFGNPGCVEGATCCPTGEWHCNDDFGGTTCDPDPIVCQACCDISTAPGVGDNPPCLDGFTCCGDGQWRCNNALGASRCDIVGQWCRPACCDLVDLPNQGDTSVCATGFDCCDGVWRCRDESGNSTCAPSPLTASACPVVCGGPTGIECADPDKFCRRPIGTCREDAYGFCTYRPVSCDLSYLPVCGCDGKTYSNRCWADGEEVSVARRGACSPACDHVRDELCREDEFCLFDDGECGRESDGSCRLAPVACPESCEPVCGCDEQAYANRCTAALAGSSVDHMGDCIEGDERVWGVTMTNDASIQWRATPGALAYNVYGRRIEERPPNEYGGCLSAGVTELAAVVPEVELLPGDLWIFQVTVVFPDGTEGSMGLGVTCRERLPRAACVWPDPVQGRFRAD